MAAVHQLTFVKQKLLVRNKLTKALESITLPPVKMWSHLNQDRNIHRSSTGACTMMVDEQIQSYRISFELTKLDHSNLALLVP